MSAQIPIAWLSHRSVPLDFGGPADRAFKPFGAPMPAIARFAQMAVRHAEALALDDGAARLTYAQTRHAVDGLAGRLRAAVAPGAPVAALLLNTALFPVVTLACLAAGCPFIPIDATDPPPRQIAILHGSGAALLLLADGVIPSEGLVPQDLACEALDLAGLLAAAPAADAARWAASIDLGAPAAIAYTSGSTALPRGFAFSQGDLMGMVGEFTNAAHLNAQDRVLGLASLSAGGARDALAALLNGGCLFIVDIKQAGIGEVLRVLADARITVLSFVPSVMRMLLALPQAEACFRSLRLLNLIGEPTLHEDLALYHRVLPADCLIRVGLGSTETLEVFHWFVPRDAKGSGPVPSGYLASGKSVALLDDRGAAAAPGEAGELVVRSRHMALGTWANGAVVQHPLIADPSEPGVRIFHTGDLAQLSPEGLVRHAGRIDRQIKVHGLRIDPGEVENVLRGVTGIAEAAVIGRAENEDTRLIAYLVATTGLAPTVAALREAAGAMLSPHAVPVEFHFLPSMPHLPTLKPDLRALQAMDAARAAPGTDVDTVADVLEQAVQAAWVKAFGAESYRADLPFNEAGADSLQILTVLFDIERVIGRPIPQDMVGAAMTPSQLVAALARLMRDPALPLDDDRPAVFLLSDDPAQSAALQETLVGWFRFVVPAEGRDAASWISAAQPHGVVNLFAIGGPGGSALDLAAHFAAERRAPGLAILIAPPPVPPEGPVFPGHLWLLRAGGEVPPDARWHARAARLSTRVIEAEGGLLLPPTREYTCASVIKAFVESQTE